MANSETAVEAAPARTTKHPGLTGVPARSERLARAAILALPAIGTIAFSLQSGGFFAGTPAAAAVAVGVVLVLRITLAEEPFAGVTRGLCVGAAALGLYAGLVLASGSWSDAPARAMIEFDRALLYWLVLVLFGSVSWRRSEVEWALRLLVLAIVAVAAVALISRLFPDVFDVTEEVAISRLSYPLTYWNTLGLMCALAIVFCLSFTCSAEEPAWSRVVAAGMLPLLGGTLFFTFSRGAIGAAAVGAVLSLLLARSRATLGGLLAAGPPLAVTVLDFYDRDLLSGDQPKSAAAAAQGHDAALVVGLCMLAAGALRVLLLLLDRRLERSSASAFRWLKPAAAVVVVVCVAGAVAVGLPGRLADTADDFVQGTENPTEYQDFRSRLTDPGNNGRIDQWNVALEGFRSEPLLGIGAGKFPEYWSKERPIDLRVEDAHSLYIENLAELGLVGLVLLVVALLALLGGAAHRARGPGRAVWAAVFGAGVGWALHSGLDWHWEMPAVTAWLFAFGGMALAATSRPPLLPAPGRFTRIALGVGCLGLLVTPALMAISQGQLNRSVDALKKGDCVEAVDAGLDAARAVRARPEPLQVVGFCDSRLGEHDLAERFLRRAAEVEPGNWQSWYGLALVRGAAGLDPRPAAARALRLNPREPLARDAVRRFRTGDPNKWKRRALSARLPIL